MPDATPPAAPLTPDVRARLVRRLRRFATSEAPAVGSPLYARLAAGAAEHDAVLAVLAAAPERQQRPTTLLAAVHDVLLRGVDHPLREHYPRLRGSAPAPVRDPVPDLVDLVERYHGELTSLVASRGTQTNEVLRAVGLAPALAVVAADVGAPLSVLEVGPSAGLHLRCDRYGYRYVDGDTTVDVPGTEELVLEAEVRHGRLPPAHLLPPPIRDRLGLDLAPIDVTADDDVRWLQACVWPEHEERARRLDVALAAARRDPPRIVRGDMVDDLATAAAALDPAGHLVVVHCVALMYLSPDRRQAFRDRLAALSRTRPVDVVAFEDRRIEPYDALAPDELAGDDAVHGLVARSRYRDGAGTHELLGRAHLHGRWIGWRP